MYAHLFEAMTSVFIPVHCRAPCGDCVSVFLTLIDFVTMGEPLRPTRQLMNMEQGFATQEKLGDETRFP